MKEIRTEIKKSNKILIIKTTTESLINKCFKCGVNAIQNVKLKKILKIKWKNYLRSRTNYMFSTGRDKNKILRTLNKNEIMLEK